MIKSYTLNIQYSYFLILIYVSRQRPRRPYRPHLAQKNSVRNWRRKQIAPADLDGAVVGNRTDRQPTPSAFCRSGIAGTC